MISFKEFQGLPVTSGIGKRYESLDAYMRRACRPAGSGPQLGNRIGARNGLGVRPINGFPVDKPHVVFTGPLYRADLSTFPATGAFIQINKPRFFVNADLKVAFFALNRFYL